MKKFATLVIILSFLGAVLSGILLYQHYFPESGLSMAACGKGMHNSCLAVSMSSYSTLFGIPLAGYGLFYFLFLLFAALITDYAGGQIRRSFLLVLLAGSFTALAADLVLSGMLIHMKAFCHLCVATYAINIGIAAVAALWYRRASVEEGFTLTGALQGLAPEMDDSYKKGFSSSFLLFIGLLAFAVFSTSYNLKLKTEEYSVSEAEIRLYMKDYEGYKPEKLDLPAPTLAIGGKNAKIRIIAFTDFLCSACYQFYKTEKYLLSRYGDQIRLEYYHYPLDTECNPGMERSLYPGSCLASRAMIAARENGVFEEYLVNHFAGYKENKKHYELRTALRILAAAVNDSGKTVDASKFSDRINSGEIRGLVAKDIAAGDRTGVTGTPTIFVNGKRLPGVLPKEIFDAIIAKELGKK